MSTTRISRNLAARSSAAGPKPRGQRVKLGMAVVLELAPGVLVQAVIDNLSQEGFRLRSKAVLHPGQCLTMRMPRGDAKCHVRWVDGLICGGIFDSEARETLA